MQLKKTPLINFCFKICKERQVSPFRPFKFNQGVFNSFGSEAKMAFLALTASKFFPGHWNGHLGEADDNLSK